MLRSTVRGETPTPLLALPCGSRSSSKVFRSAAATLAARLTAVVVLPTPPFWFTTAMTRPGRAASPRSGAPGLLMLAHLCTPRELARARPPETAGTREQNSQPFSFDG